MQPTMATAVVCIVALMGCVSVENVDVTKAEPVSARETCTALVASKARLGRPDGARAAAAGRVNPTLSGNWPLPGARAAYTPTSCRAAACHHSLSHNVCISIAAGRLTSAQIMYALCTLRVRTRSHTNIGAMASSG